MDHRYPFSPTVLYLAPIPPGYFLLRRDGRLSHGDELLMVNGKSVVGLTRPQVVDILKATSTAQLLVATKVLIHFLTCATGQECKLEFLISIWSFL